MKNRRVGEGGRLASSLLIPSVCAVLQTLALDQGVQAYGCKEKRSLLND